MKTQPVKNQSLAIIPASVEASVRPKPSKAEIIDALTELREAEIIAENRKKVERRKELEPVIEKRLRKLAKGAEMDLVSYGWVMNGKASDARFEVRLRTIPADLQALIVEHDKLPRCAVIPDTRKVRKEVSERVNGSLCRTERVEAILSDPESKAALKDALAKLYAS